MPDEDIEHEPLLDLDLGQNGGVFKPRDLEELQEWIDAERLFWEWLDNDPVAQEGALGPIRAMYNKGLQRIQGLVDQLKGAPTDDAIKEATSKEILGQFGEEKRLHSRSVKAAWMNQLREEDPAVAAAALSFIHELELNVGSNKFARGAIQACFMLAGVDHRTPQSVNTELGKLHAAHATRLNQDSKEASALKALTVLSGKIVGQLPVFPK